jgi:FG-GAP-like repeat
MRRVMAGLVAALVMLPCAGVATASGPRFETEVIAKVDGYPTDVAIARMDADRRPDIAVAIDRGVTAPGGAQTVVNRRWGFLLRPFAAGGTTPYRIATGDLDGDGDDDAVVPDTVSEDVTVFANDGAGALAAAATHPVPYLTRGIAVAELDGDRRLDVVTSSLDDPDGFGSASFRLLSGAAGPPTAVPAADAFVPAETITAVDVSGDRRRDLVAVDQSGVLLSRRTAAGFEPVRRLALVEEGPFDVAAGDLDGDGRTDLATANLLGTRVAVLLNGPAGFAPPAYVDVGAGSAQIEIADFDRDGRNDLAVTRLDAGQVAVLRGARRGGFRPPRLYDAGPVPLALEAADMDRDGDVDLVVGDRDSGEIRLLVNCRW